MDSHRIIKQGAFLHFLPVTFDQVAPDCYHLILTCFPGFLHVMETKVDFLNTLVFLSVKLFCSGVLKNP